MRAGDYFALAWRNVFRRGARSLLCAGSVAVGILFVTLIAAAGQLLSGQVEGALSQLGIGGLTIYEEGEGTGVLDSGSAAALAERFPFVSAAMPLVAQMGHYENSRLSGRALLLGVGEELEQTVSLEVLAGRLPTENEIAMGANVVVIDEELSQLLYRRVNCTGKTLWVSAGQGMEEMTIIGVVSSQKGALSSWLGGQLPQFLYLPYSTVNRLRQSEEIDQLVVQCAAGSDLEQCRQTLEQSFARAGQPLKVQNLDGYLDLIRRVAGLLSLFLTVIAAISLVVAGLGVANFMLSSARERRGEIGLYLALGMAPRQVSRLFLIESLLLCLLGGAAGAAAAGTALLAAGRMGAAVGECWGVLPVALALSALCGVLAGALPARRAGRVSPMESMREM